MPAPLVLPPLPPASVVTLPGRGEFFVRQVEGSASSPPCLLIHGWQATADINFFPLFAPLAARHPAVAADLRGHGRSACPEDGFTLEAAADDNAALLDALGLDRAIVVGYSIGSAVAQTMAQRHPDRVAALVLAGGELVPDRRRREKLAQRAGGWIGSVQRLTEGRRLAHRLVTRAKRSNPAVEPLRPWLVAEMERGHAGSIRAAGRALGRFDGSSIAASRTLAAACVIATQDKLVHPDKQWRLADAWGAYTVVLDADHDAPVAAPDRFVAAMLDAIGYVARSLSLAAPVS